jgi:hypothetical protein
MKDFENPVKETTKLIDFYNYDDIEKQSKET